MAYEEDVPQGSQTKAASQPIIEGNFQFISAAMRVDHTFNTNENVNAIAGEASGSHQKLSMPNQPSDLSGALPTGIAAEMYCIGGNLFTWNGTQKNPVSAITYSNATQPLTTAFADLLLMPSNCYGMFTIPGGSGGTVFFFSIANSGFFQQTGAPSLSVQVITVSSVLHLQIKNTIAGNVPLKMIYWITA